MGRTSALIGLSVVSVGLLLAASTTTTSKDPFTPAQRNFWAFQPVHRINPPAVKRQEMVANPIDAFVASKLDAKGLSLSPAADKVTLLRRVSFDLIGLPPTPAEVDAFLADKSPDAYEK